MPCIYFMGEIKIVKSMNYTKDQKSRIHIYWHSSRQHKWDVLAKLQLGEKDTAHASMQIIYRIKTIP